MKGGRNRSYFGSPNSPPDGLNECLVVPENTSDMEKPDGGVMHLWPSIPAPLSSSLGKRLWVAPTAALENLLGCFNQRVKFVGIAMPGQLECGKTNAATIYFYLCTCYQVFPYFLPPAPAGMSTGVFHSNYLKS
jgi:hypothetical protein